MLQAVKKAIQAVEGKRRKARPVDPKEAARGRLDYVQVKDWGGGSPEDLASMQVPPAGLTISRHPSTGLGAMQLRLLPSVLSLPRCAFLAACHMGRGQVTSFESAGSSAGAGSFYEELALRLGELEVLLTPHAPSHVPWPYYSQDL